ncbi:hypothetical protein Poli38472_011696 [Pythium oligandrum]|uniref:GST C-terminal domain-containing protein n=1 Tax=Pythium oligandrum TaxID=41045 RepID=A0A8K1FGU5_PYTOL|nr:hypothetical protein Poli38472_011696 [Pythium oligandrum]|eukprot:TMW58108.1 hypothetical protein Poli38472_011696 [Pythium oligandrum]
MSVASRALMAIHLKGLQDCISVTATHPMLLRTRPDDEDDLHKGWVFDVNGEYEGTSPDPIHGAKSIRDLFERVTKETVSYSVPLLWDKKTDTIVSTESADMVRMFNEAFEDPNPSNIDLYPEALREKIDDVNTWLHDSVILGAVKPSFVKEEDVPAAVAALYAALDRVEEILSTQRYLVGNVFTEADLRLFVVLIRFDVSFFHLFKHPKRIETYLNISNYLRDIYQLPGVKETVNFDHIRLLAVGAEFNRDNIVLEPPTVDYSAPHDRTRFA